MLPVWISQAFVHATVKDSFISLTANILQRQHWFPLEMTSGKRVQKLHTDVACFWLVVPYRKFTSTNQKHCPDPGGDLSSIWNFYALISFHRETSGGIMKCHLFCQANHLFFYLFYYFFEMFRFSFQKAFIGVVKETDDLAGQHELIVESLTEKVYKEFHLLHNELKTERRKVGSRVIFPGDVVNRFLKIFMKVPWVTSVSYFPNSVYSRAQPCGISAIWKKMWNKINVAAPPPRIRNIFFEIKYW